MYLNIVGANLSPTLDAKPLPCIQFTTIKKQVTYINYFWYFKFQVSLKGNTMPASQHTQIHVIVLHIIHDVEKYIMSIAKNIVYRHMLKKQQFIDRTYTNPFLKRLLLQHQFLSKVLMNNVYCSTVKCFIL